jgi:hypothetical protein
METTMPDKRYTKVEEEVIEILDRLEHEAPAPVRPNLRLVSSRPRRRRRWDDLRSRLRARAPRVSGVWIAVAVVIGLFALTWAPIDLPGGVAMLLIFAIIGVFLWGMLRGGSSRPSGGGFAPPGTKTWRGRDITFGPDPGAAPAERIARWFRRSGRPRR